MDFSTVYKFGRDLRWENITCAMRMAGVTILCLDGHVHVPVQFILACFMIVRVYCCFTSLTDNKITPRNNHVQKYTLFKHTLFISVFGYDTYTILCNYSYTITK